jgi:phosphoenolpyruvate-protein phosphotransferase (PTS system enzyme I)
MTELYARPFAPGQACGRLQRGHRGSGIVVLEQAQVSRVAGEPAGLIVVNAAPFSHCMIRLLGLGVPVVLTEGAQAATLVPGTETWIDGGLGLVVQPAGDRTVSPPPGPAPAGVHSADGVAIELRATVGDAPGAARARAAGASAIGLVRTEYLGPTGTGAPDAEFYRAAFTRVIEAAGGIPVTLRLLDIAADKRPRWLGLGPGAGSPLGLQGARLYSEGPARRAMEAQLEALARLPEGIAFRLLVPYLTSPEEFAHWRDVIRTTLPRTPPVGAMVETPALALMLGELLDAADFVAIGLNDLMQCLFAADRDLPALRPYLDPHAPALYRLLGRVANDAGERADRIQLCGLLPQLPGILPVLLGLGFRVISAAPSLIPYLALRVQRVRIDQAQVLAGSVCAAHDSETVRRLLASMPHPGSDG